MCIYTHVYIYICTAISMSAWCVPHSFPTSAKDGLSNVEVAYSDDPRPDGLGMAKRKILEYQNCFSGGSTQTAPIYCIPNHVAVSNT